MVKVSLIDCKHCCSLPPLGQLPSLRELKVLGFDSLVRIGAEFYFKGSSEINPFRSLEILHFEGMLKWRQWSFVQGHREAAVFPHLKELNLVNCSKLDVQFPIGLRSRARLQSLEIGQSAASLPMAHQVDTIFPSLQRMTIENCPELKSFPGSGLPSNLIKLDITNCNKLLAHRMHWDLQRLTSLRSLRIEDCKDMILQLFPEGLLPVSLTSFTIVDLPNLRVLNG